MAGRKLNLTLEIGGVGGWPEGKSIFYMCLELSFQIAVHLMSKNLSFFFFI